MKLMFPNTSFGIPLKFSSHVFIYHLFHDAAKLRETVSDRSNASVIRKISECLSSTKFHSILRWQMKSPDTKASLSNRIQASSTARPSRYTILLINFFSNFIKAQMTPFNLLFNIFNRFIETDERICSRITNHDKYLACVNHALTIAIQLMKYIKQDKRHYITHLRFSKSEYRAGLKTVSHRMETLNKRRRKFSFNFNEWSVLRFLKHRQYLYLHANIFKQINVVH